LRTGIDVELDPVSIELDFVQPVPAIRWLAPELCSTRRNTLLALDRLVAGG